MPSPTKMNSPINTDAWVLVSCVLLALIITRFKGFARLPLPPGPKPLPIVGNFFQLNITRPWLTYTHWKKKYGMQWVHSNKWDVLTQIQVI